MSERFEEDEQVELVEVVELVELGPGEVGALAGGRRVGSAGWAADAAGVRLIGVVVEPEWRGRGIGGALLAAVEELAAGATRGLITARPTDPEGAEWLRKQGYRGTGPHLTRPLPVLIEVPTAEAMQALGRHLGALFRRGDLVILTGDLGAGKTTLTQGLGAGLGVTEAITSPTFVLSRIHPGGAGRPDLVHVDAYRLGGDEVDDIDLDSDLDHSVTVIEWGAGVAEQLSDQRLEIEIRRSDDPADETREVLLRGVGARWENVNLSSMNAGEGDPA